MSKSKWKVRAIVGGLALKATCFGSSIRSGCEILGILGSWFGWLGDGCRWFEGCAGLGECGEKVPKSE